MKLSKEIVEAICKQAQNVYDSWKQDENGFDEWYGEGGICDDISEEISNIFTEKNIDNFSHYCEYNTHTSVYAKFNGDWYNVDIPHTIYETGFGYKWVKVENVEFTPDMIVVEPVSYELIQEMLSY